MVPRVFPPLGHIQNTYDHPAGLYCGPDFRSNALLLYVSTVAHRNARPLGVLAFVGFGLCLCLLVSNWLRAFVAVRPLRSRYSRSAERSHIHTGPEVDVQICLCLSVECRVVSVCCVYCLSCVSVCLSV